MPAKWKRTKPRTKGTCQVCGKPVYLGGNGIWYHYGNSPEKPEPHEAKPKTD